MQSGDPLVQIIDISRCLTISPDILNPYISVFIDIWGTLCVCLPWQYQ